MCIREIGICKGISKLDWLFLAKNVILSWLYSVKNIKEKFDIQIYAIAIDMCKYYFVILHRLCFDWFPYEYEEIILLSRSYAVDWCRWDKDCAKSSQRWSIKKFLFKP